MKKVDEGLGSLVCLGQDFVGLKKSNGVGVIISVLVSGLNDKGVEIDIGLVKGLVFRPSFGKKSLNSGLRLLWVQREWLLYLRV